MLGAGALSRSFPMGLGGMLAGKEATMSAMGTHALSDQCGAVKPQDFKDIQDQIAWVVAHFSGDELALLYKTLYDLGHRHDYCAAAVQRLKERFKP